MALFFITEEADHVDVATTQRVTSHFKEGLAKYGEKRFDIEPPFLAMLFVADLSW